MSEKRFVNSSKRFKPIKNYGKAVNEVFIKDRVNDWYISTEDDVVDLLNEQQSTIEELEEEIKLLKPTNIEQYEQIQKLQEENEQLKERRDYWSKKTKEFIYYFNCLEKAIEKTFDSDNQCFEEIWKHYDGMEKKWEYNDSFVGNWTDKPVLLERKMVNINENRDKQRLLAKQGKGISRRE